MKRRSASHLAASPAQIPAKSPKKRPFLRRYWPIGALFGLGAIAGGVAMAHSQSQLFFDSSGTDQAGYGVDQIITISGNFTFHGRNDFPKPDGAKDDIFRAAADVYVLPQGYRISATARVPLKDVNETPNTITALGGGSSFSEQVIATTGPQGALPTGGYNVVIDEHQDGFFDPAHDLFIGSAENPAITVDVPFDAPGVPNSGIAQMKASAVRQFQNAALLSEAYRGILNLVGASGRIADPLDAQNNPGDGTANLLYVLSVRKNFFQIIGVLKKLFDERVCGARCVQAASFAALPYVAAETALQNQIKSYTALAADPPDPDFRKYVTIAPFETTPVTDLQPLSRAFAGLADAQNQEANVANALLHALEKYQGADAANDGYWALVHAREIQDYCALLSDHIGRTQSAIAALQSAIASDGSRLDRLAQIANEERARLRDSGFTIEERKFFLGLGLPSSEIDLLRTTILADPIAPSRNEILAQLDAQSVTEGDSVAGFRALGDSFNGVISTLTGTSAKKNVDLTQPTARLVTPSSGFISNSIGKPVRLDASISTDPSAFPLSYAWDLDADGAFDDATGATISPTFAAPFAGHFGVRATNTEGESSIRYLYARISDPNRAPVFTKIEPATGFLTLAPGASQTFRATATDADGDALTISYLFDGKPAASSNGEFSYSPAAGDVGPHGLITRVSDNRGGSTTHFTLVGVARPVSFYDLGVSQTDSPDPVVSGENVTYTLTVRNSGPDAVTGATLMDTLPSGAQFVASNPAPSATNGRDLRFDLGDLGTADDTNSRVISITLKSGAAGQLQNVARVMGSANPSVVASDLVAENNGSTEITTVSAPTPARADLSVVLSASSETATVGNNLVYSATVQNLGPATATGVILTNRLPANVQFVASNPAPTTRSGGVLTFDLGAVSVGSSGEESVSITVRPTATGTLSNAVDVAGQEVDSQTDNNRATLSTIVAAPSPKRADLEISLASSATSVVAGSEVTFTFNAKNNGPDAATNVRLSSTLPAGTALVSATGTQGDATLASRVVTANLGDLAAGDTAGVTLILRANAPGTLSLSGNITAVENDLNAANNSALVQVRVVAPAPTATPGPTATPTTPTPTPTPVAGQVADAVGDFSPDQNPNSPWSYGWSTTRGTAFNLSTFKIADSGNGIDGWAESSDGPFVYRNKKNTAVTYNDSISHAPDLLNVTPGFDPRNAIVRWTAPQTGFYRVQGRFQGMDTVGTTSDAAILQGSSTLFSGAVNGFGTRLPFDLALGLQAGQTLDFSVGKGAGDSLFDSTGLAATISRAAELPSRVAIVRNFADGEIDQLQNYLSEMGLPSQVFDQEGLTFSQLSGFDLIIWDDLSFAAGGLTNNDVGVFKAANDADIPLYFIGDDLALAATNNLTEPQRSQWVALTHLNATANNSGGAATVTIQNAAHPVISGPFGVVSDFATPGDPDGTTRTQTGDVLLASSGADPILLATDARNSAAGNEGARIVTQNVVAVNGGAATVSERKKLFQNAVMWLLSSTSDLAAEFSPDQNPNPPWSYGYSTTRGTAFQLMTRKLVDAANGLDGWSESDNGPYVIRNTSGATASYATIRHPVELLNLDPSFDGRNAIVRWTAPAAGFYRVRGRFQGIDVAGTTTDAAVLKGGATELTSGAINGFGARLPIDLSVALAAGETLDFSVGQGTGGSLFDSTGLEVSITRTNFVPIDLRAFLNIEIESRSTFARGDAILGQVPFVIPTTGFTEYFANGPASLNPIVINVPVGVAQARAVHTLFNTAWGADDGSAYASIEFFGTGGAYFKKDLIGNVDIRDLVQTRFTNTINNTTTVQVEGTSTNRLDKQNIVLPASFRSQTLTSIRITDTGGIEFQRLSLRGITVEGVPTDITAPDPGVTPTPTPTPNPTATPTPAPDQADIALTLSASSASVSLGQEVTLTLSATNRGPNLAPGVRISQSLPPGEIVSITASKGTATPQNGELNIDFGALALDESATVQVVVRPQTVGTLLSGASLRSAASDPNSANNEAQISFTVGALQADLGITMSGIPANATIGDAFDFTLKATNRGPNPATNATLLDTLPAGLEVVSATSDVGTVAARGVNIAAILGDLAPDASATIKVRVRVTAAGVLINTARVSSSENDPNSANNEASQTVNALGAGQQADLRVSLLAGPQPASVGNALTLTFLAANAGAGTASDAVLVGTLPIGVTIASSKTTRGTVSQSGQVVTAQIGTLSPGETVRMTVVVQPRAAGQIVTKASVSSTMPDPILADNSAIQTTNVAGALADLVVSQSDAPDPARAGEGLTYRITVQNNGPGAATKTSLSNVLPAGVSFVRVVASQGTASQKNGSVTASLGTLAKGAKATIEVVVRPTVGGTLVNTARVSSGVSDPALSNNASTISTRVASAIPTISIDNITMPEGNSGADNATFSVRLSSPSVSAVSVRVASANGTALSGTDYDALTKTLSFAPQETVKNVLVRVKGDTAIEPDETFELRLSAASGGTISVSNGIGRGTISNDDVAPPAPIADLSLRVSAAPNSVEEGEIISYNFTVSSAGPDGATNVRLSDVLPAGLQFIESQPAPTTRSGQNLTFDLGSLAAGQNRSVVIKAKAISAGQISNSASVAATQRDSNTANNAATATVAVTSANACAADVSAQIAVTRGPLIPDGYIPGAFGQKARYIQKVTLRNTGSKPLVSPFSLVIDNLRGAKLKNPIVGLTTCATPLGRPYLDVPLPGGVLAPQQEVSIQLRFDEASNSLSYAVKILAGPGTR